MTYHYRYFDDGAAEQKDYDSFPLALRRAVEDAAFETAVPVEIRDQNGNVVGRDVIVAVADWFRIASLRITAVTNQEVLAELDRVRWRLS